MKPRKIWGRVRYRLLRAWDSAVGLFSDMYWAIVWLRYAISLYRALGYYGRFEIYAYWKPLDAPARPVFVKEIRKAVANAYEKARPAPLKYVPAGMFHLGEEETRRMADEREPLSPAFDAAARDSARKAGLSEAEISTCSGR